jgi:diacylglycerol kinase (ATP)
VRLILLHNPGSGDEDHSRASLEAMLTDAGHEVVYRTLDDDGWRGSLGDTRDVIVVAGGDGSVRKVLTAIGDSPTTVTLFPTGSANNIARTLGFETDDPVRLLAGWEPATRSPYDVWEVKWAGEKSRFVESVGGGLFGQVLALAENARGKPGGDEKVEQGLELLDSALGAMEPGEWRLEIDGKLLREELIGVEAMNVRELGPNLPLAPDADPGDGLLDVVLLRPDDRLQLEAYVSARLHDEDGSIRFEVLRGSHLVLEPPASHRVHADDVLAENDSGGSRRAEIQQTNASIEVLVPAFTDRESQS